jgi:MFS family permease
MRTHRRLLGRHRRPAFGQQFTRLWLGFSLASTGDGLANGAVPLLAVVIDPHPVAVSAVFAADSLPWFLMALPAGAFADRFERGSVTALANVLRAAVVLFAAMLIMSGRMNLTLLILFVLANAGGRAVYYSSVQAMVPDIVDSDGLERANGVLSGTEAGTEHLAGPVAGSALFAATPSAPFLGEAVALLSSCFPFVRFRTKGAAADAQNSSTSMWEGARLLFSDRRLRVLVLMVGSLAGLQGMVSGVLVLLATKEWGIRTGAYGLFLAAGALGTLLGSVVAARLVKRFGNAKVLIGAAGLSGVAYLAMAAAYSWVLAGPAFAFVGVAIGTGNVAAISLRQRLTPPNLMGRVGGAWRGIVWGAAPVGALAAGTLAAYGGLRLPVVLAGVLQCAVALVLAGPMLRAISPAVRETPGPDSTPTAAG